MNRFSQKCDSLDVAVSKTSNPSIILRYYAVTAKLGSCTYYTS